MATKKITWKTGNGSEAIITVKHVLSETVWSDGDSAIVSCDKIEVVCSIPSMGVTEYGTPCKSHNPAHIAAGAFATIGRVGFNESIYNDVMSAIAAFTSEKKHLHPQNAAQDGVTSATHIVMEIARQTKMTTTIIKDIEPSWPPKEIYL